MTAFSRSRARSWGLAGLAVAVVAAAGWRATLGVDLGDGAHAVALAVRLARGDQPFVDEMNVQALGSWPAVPFTWLWMRLVGLDGIVLASRLFYVAWATGCAVLAWRALAPHVGRGVAAGGVAFAALPAAYNLQFVSYNTSPALMLLVATAAGIATWGRGSVRWGVAAGAATVLAALSHPVTTPAALALAVGLLVLARGRARMGVLSGLLGASATLGVLAASVWGAGAIAETLSFTQLYQAERLPPAERLAVAWEWYALEARGPLLGAALLVALVATVPAARKARVALVVAAVVLTTLHAVGRGVAPDGVWTWSWLSPGVALALAIVLSPLAWVTAGRARGAVGLLLVLGLPTTAIGLPVVAALTSSAPVWGAVAAVLPPALLAVAVAVLTAVREDGRWAAVVVAAALVASVGLAHAATSYREPVVTSLDTRVEEGAFAGLLTTRGRRETIRASTEAVRSCLKQGDGLLNYSFPAAHLMAEADFATPIIWLGPFGESNDAVVDRIVLKGPPPDCIAGARTLWPGFGTSVHVRDGDPFLLWVAPRYAPMVGSDALVVLHRIGSGS